MATASQKNGSQQQAVARVNGKFAPGVSGNPGGSPGRARQALNADTIREMHRAFQDGGRAVIDKVMKNQPAVFLKLLVLLVPREMRVEQTGGVKAMSDEQLEQGIEAITAMLAAREAGENARVIEGVADASEAPALPAPRAKRKRNVGQTMGKDRDSANSLMISMFGGGSSIRPGSRARNVSVMHW